MRRGFRYRRDRQPVALSAYRGDHSRALLVFRDARRVHGAEKRQAAQYRDPDLDACHRYATHGPILMLHVMSVFASRSTYGNDAHDNRSAIATAIVAQA
jgi:hypothetical protein